MLITDLLALSHVPRWSNVRHASPQSVADHSFRVAAIYIELCKRLRKEPSLRGLTYALFHDGAEAYTGDIPGDFKRSIAEEVRKAESVLPSFYEAPIQAERDLVKIADKVETYTFIYVNGVGAHSQRIVLMMYTELMALVAAESWPVVKLLCHDIIEETERN